MPAKKNSASIKTFLLIKKSVRLFIYGWCAVLFAACISTKKNHSGKGDTFIYNFWDSYNTASRDVQITVTPSAVYLSIAAYGTTLYQDTTYIPAERYTRFLTDLTALHIVKGVYNKGGCIGGSSHQLRLFAGSKKELSGRYTSCSGTIFGDLTGDVPAASVLFQSMAPDLYEKIDATDKD